MLLVEHVQKSFGTARAVSDVSFRAERGAMLALLGSNGAGKTTTMRMILGVLRPDRGSISWEGKPVVHRMRRTFGYLPEERGLYGKMRVREQIAFFARLHGLSEREALNAADGWIERLGIAAYASRTTAELSKGNQQKVQLACAAAHRPQLLILDEPFSGLDPINGDEFAAVLTELRSQGTTLLLSSHQLGRLQDLCDEFCIIARGRVVMQKTRAQLGAASLHDLYVNATKAES